MATAEQIKIPSSDAWSEPRIEQDQTITNPLILEALFYYLYIGQRNIVDQLQQVPKTVISPKEGSNHPLQAFLLFGYSEAGSITTFIDGFKQTVFTFKTPKDENSLGFSHHSAVVEDEFQKLDFYKGNLISREIFRVGIYDYHSQGKSTGSGLYSADPSPSTANQISSDFSDTASIKRANFIYLSPNLRNELFNPETPHIDLSNRLLVNELEDIQQE